MPPVDPPKALSKKNLALVARIWRESIVMAMSEDLTGSLALLDRIIVLIPTSAAAHFSRSNVHKRLGKRAAQAADLKQSVALAKLAATHAWPLDPIAALKLPPPVVKQAPLINHTMDQQANFYAAEVTLDELAAARITPLASAAGKARVVAGARSRKRGFEAVAFGEVQRGRKWTLATKTLVGKPAETAVARLAKKNRALGDLADALDGVLDGFEEQAGYAADFD